MIPAFVTREHIVDAVGRIGRDGVPARRGSRKYCLVCDGRHYPPKYTISLAHEVATGYPLSSAAFSGGSESIRFLMSRGFEVGECGCGGMRQIQPTTSPLKTKASKRPKVHSQNCHRCKMRVQEILERIYGNCRSNHRFGWRTKLTAYEGTLIYPALRDVAEALKEDRGFGVEDFIKTKVLAGCDFWVPNPGFIVEFDESQHFTKPRMLALLEYPDNQPLGFSRERWIALCEKHDAKDNSPPYRDEQRAWYDTLRDFVPLLNGLKPTLRLYARDFTWCSLDPDREVDRRRFLEMACRGGSPANKPRGGINSPMIPAGSSRLALLMMGRAIECCAPILISDRTGIHELVELANRNKIPVRRTIEPSGEAIVDLDFAWGLRNAFKIVASNLPSTSAVGRRTAHEYKRRAFERYQSLVLQPESPETGITPTRG